MMLGRIKYDVSLCYVCKEVISLCFGFADYDVI